MLQKRTTELINKIHILKNKRENLDFLIKIYNNLLLSSFDDEEFQYYLDLNIDEMKNQIVKLNMEIDRLLFVVNNKRNEG